jgi:predicted naringenin-chalcone synthase
MTRILTVRGALPEHRRAQSEITDAFATAVAGHGLDERVLRTVHRNCGVRQRHLVLPLADYDRVDTFDRANDLFLEHAVALGARALEDALKAAGLTPTDVDLIISTTVTGLAVPSLDARIAAVVGLRPDVRRVPLFGLGCVAGAASLAIATISEAPPSTTTAVSRVRRAPSRCGRPRTPVASSSARSGSALTRCAPTPSNAPTAGIQGGGSAPLGPASETNTVSPPKATA